MKKSICVLLLCLSLVSCGTKAEETKDETVSLPTMVEETEKSKEPEPPVVNDFPNNSSEEEGLLDEWEEWEREQREQCEKYDVDHVPNAYLANPVPSNIIAANGAELYRTTHQNDVKLTIGYGQPITVLANSYGLGELGAWCFVEYNGVYGWAEIKNLDTQKFGQ